MEENHPLVEIIAATAHLRKYTKLILEMTMSKVLRQVELLWVVGGQFLAAANLSILQHWY